MVLTVTADKNSLPYRSANEVWSRRVAEAGGRRAFLFRQGGGPQPSPWREVTFQQADDWVRATAAGLVALGMQAGDRVCVLAQTRMEWLLCDLGALFAGAIVVPIYPSSTPAQTAHIVRDAGARAIVAEDAAQLEKVLPLLLTGLDLVLIYIEGDAKLERPGPDGRTHVKLDDVLAQVPREARARVISWEDLLTRGRAHATLPDGAAVLARRSEGVALDDPFTIIYTSGTTGSPKGVVLSHRNLLSGCLSAIRALTMRQEDVHYLWLTLAHVFARQVAWVSLIEGQTIAFTSGIARIKDDLVDLRPTFFAGVPRVFEKFHSGVKITLKQGSAARQRLAAWALKVGQRHSVSLQRGKPEAGLAAFEYRLADKLVLSRVRQRLGLDRCRFLVSGGAPLATEVAEFFHAIGVLILEGYGLTETTAACFVNRMDRYRFGTVGPAVDVIDCKFADDGELLLRGPSVFRAYHGDAEATAAAIDGQGWFHSGDIGVLEDGLLRITDRKKDLIVLAGGKKVAPQVLETALAVASPLIGQALVYGDRRPYCVALVTPSEEATRRLGSGDVAAAAKHPDLLAAVKAAVAAVNGTLASFESIKSFAVLGEDFTEENGQLTPSLKVKRKVVIERHLSIITGLYS